MSRRPTLLALAFLVVGLLACAGATPPPLKYVSLERPEGVIDVDGRTIDQSFSRGGFYFLNFGFRPAPEIGEYLKSAAGSRDIVLKNADVELNVPFALDILMFGYNSATDSVTARPH